MKNGVKLTYTLAILSILFPILHNVFYAIFGIEEAVFFLLSLLVIVLFPISAVFNFYTYKKTGEPKNIWKLGFLGLLGPLLVVLLNTSNSMLGLMGFFGFFALKKNK
ncbi:MAG: hypothetical protein GOU98_02155 [Candidatus Altiarchaeota archaeon]|nr:hypothetical protein [Candidatus Altiarchaeota archaeon]